MSTDQIRLLLDEIDATEQNYKTVIASLEADNMEQAVTIRELLDKLAECEDPDPPSKQVSGAWAIRQVQSRAELASTSVRNEINRALPDVDGFGLRVPVNVLLPSAGQFDARILDDARALTQAAGKQLKIRTIWGKYTPAFATDGFWAGGVPIQFQQDGSPNRLFEMAYEFLTVSLCAWQADKDDVVELDQGWYSRDYSELYFGPEVQRAWGGTIATNRPRSIAAHARLMLKSHELGQEAGIQVGFGLSGHGPTVEFVEDLSNLAADLGPGVIVQANGWGPGGVWGADAQTEAQKDAALNPNALFALQDIYPRAPRTVSDWSGMGQNAHNRNARYVEVYTGQWALGNVNVNQAALDEQKRVLATF